MKFNLRTIDADKNTDPIYDTQSSSHSSTFMIRGIPNRNLNGSCVGMDMTRGRFEMREELVREVEKERIRAQIIAEELGRRRVLEEEVRNELRMERDMMAMSSNGGFPSQFMPVSLPPSHVNRLEPRFLHQQPVGLEERIIMSIADKHGHGVHRGVSVSPFQQFGESPNITGIHKPQPKDTEKEVIVLTKCSGESLCGMKRKSVTPVAEGSSEPRADISKKKVKKEWSCAICQVSATSERALNDHLQGKKHHLKEAALIAEKTGANIGLGVAPKKPIAKPVKLSLTTVDVSSSEKTKSEAKKILVNETPETIRTPITPESSDTKAEAIKKENKSNNFKFWCEMCQIGAHSVDVMNNHKKGKKHLNKQLRKGKVDTEAPAIEKVCDADEETETETKNVVDVEMVACDMKTDTQTMKSVDVEIVANEAKSETETKKEVVVEAVKTVIDDKQDVNEDEADTVVEDEAEV
ncbi:zinc finger, U1-type containing protein [Tanacetum coccineum]